MGSMIPFSLGRCTPTEKAFFGFSLAAQKLSNLRGRTRKTLTCWKAAAQKTNVFERASLIYRVFREREFLWGLRARCDSDEVFRNGRSECCPGRNFKREGQVVSLPGISRWMHHVEAFS